MGTSSLMPTYPAAVIVGHIALMDAQPGSEAGKSGSFSEVAGHPHEYFGACVEPNTKTKRESIARHAIIG
jgi:hypothetical protein